MESPKHIQFSSGKEKLEEMSWVRGPPGPFNVLQSTNHGHGITQHIQISWGRENFSGIIDRKQKKTIWLNLESAIGDKFK